MTPSLRTTALAALCGLMVVSRPIVAQEHPDFSGSWIVDSVSVSGADRGLERVRRAGGGLGGGGVRGLGRRGGGRAAGDRRGGRGEGRDDTVGSTSLQKGQRVEIAQTETLLTVVVAPDAGGRVVRYPLDGSDGFTAGPGGTPLKTRTVWDGVTLVTESKATDRDSGFRSRDVRRLDAATGMMTVDTTIETPLGKRALTATLKRRDE